MSLRCKVVIAVLVLVAACATEAAKTCTLGWRGSQRVVTGKREATLAGQTLQQCIDACVQSPTCVAFRWTPSGTAGTCTTYAFIDLKFTFLYLSTDPSGAIPADRPIGGRCGVQGPLVTGAFGGPDKSYMSEPMASVDLCSYACEGYRDEGCRAYIWTKEDGGTCYYVAARPSEVSGPFDGSVVSGEIIDCRTQFDVEIVGADLAQVFPRPDWRACWGECRRTSQCRGSTWTTDNGGTCWLKKNYTNKVARKGVISNTPNPQRGSYSYPNGY